MNKKRSGLVPAACIVSALAAGMFFYAGIWTAGNQEENAGQEENGNKGTKANERKEIIEGKEANEGKKGDQEEKLTIWLDKDSEYNMRFWTSFYIFARDAAKGTDMEEWYTDMDFAFVSKNSLSPRQFREELYKALEAGEGPDIIYMDEYNGINPRELIESGKLAPLGEEAATRMGETLEYAAGVLEAGQRDGRNYVLPIAMECPVVFGMKEELKAAGLQTDQMYGSLEEFVDALLLAQEQTGKKIFESRRAADWLEQYCLPEEGDGRLFKKLEKVRALSGEDESQLGAFYGLSQRECLLGGCGIYDYKKLAVSASLLGEREIAYLGIPDCSGAMHGIITNSAAVSANSRHQEEARKALRMFTDNGALQLPDITVINEKKENMRGMLETIDILMPLLTSFRALPDKGLADGADEAFLKCTVEACSGASYVQEYGDRVRQTGKEDEKESEKKYGAKKVVSINYADQGQGEEYPPARWLNAACKEYNSKHADTYLQPLPYMGSRTEVYINYRKMDKSGTAPDAVVCRAAGNLFGKVPRGTSGVGADFRKQIADAGSGLDFLPDLFRKGIRYGESVVGLPVQVREYGAWVSRKMLKKAGLAADWKPEDASKLADGLEKLAKAAGPSYLVSGISEIQAFALFAEPDSLLAEQEDGSIKYSEESWTAVLAMLKRWKEAGTLLPADQKKEAMQKLADGEAGLVFGCSDLSGYVNGAYGAAMTKKQQKDLLFLSLSPAADAEILFVSKNSDCAGEVFAFWKEALQHPDYAKCIRADCGIPVTEVSENVQRFLPMQEVKWTAGELERGLWETDLPAEELAGQYPLSDRTG